MYIKSSRKFLNPIPNSERDKKIITRKPGIGFIRSREKIVIFGHLVAKKLKKRPGPCIQGLERFLSFFRHKVAKIRFFYRDLIKQIPGYSVIIFLSRSGVGMGF